LFGPGLFCRRSNNPSQLLPFVVDGTWTIWWASARTNRLPFAQRLLLDVLALSCRPRHTPTHDANGPADGSADTPHPDPGDQMPRRNGIDARHGRQPHHCGRTLLHQLLQPFLQYVPLPFQQFGPFQALIQDQPVCRTQVAEV